MRSFKVVPVAVSLLAVIMLLAIAGLTGTMSSAQPVKSSITSSSRPVVQAASASGGQTGSFARQAALPSHARRPDYHRQLWGSSGHPNSPSLPHPRPFDPATIQPSAALAGTEARPQSPDSSWGQVPAPAVGPANSYLQGVTMLAPNYGWAVGSYGDSATLIQHWDGSSWTVLPSPNPAKYNYLTAVDYALASDAYAVGYAYNDSSDTTPLALHWDSTSWTLMSGLPALDGALDSVKVVGPGDVWAVGSYVSGGHLLPLTLHYSASSWTVVPAPVPGQNSGLFVVRGSGSADIWAAGSYYNGSDPFNSTGFIVHWNGVSWTTSPAPANAQVTALTVASPTSAWAFADSSSDPFSDHELILHWNGSSWRAQTAPGDPTTYQLFSAAWVSGSEVWAVGHQGSAAIRIHTTNAGANWSIVSGPGGAGDLAAVSASASNDVVAVGCAFSCAHTRVEQWSGAAWNTLANYPAVGRADAIIADAVALDASHAWAVGYFSDNQPLLYSWDGSAWSAVTGLPLPPGSTDAVLESVSADSLSDVWVAGYYYDSSGANISLVLHYDGTSWTFVPINSQQYSATDSISALAASDVWAEDTSVIVHYDGGGWTPSYEQFSSFMSSVAARTSNDVWALGQDVSGASPRQLILHYTGSWQELPPPTFSQQVNLYRILPISASEAWAMGSLCSSGVGGSCQPLILHWSGGSSWTQVSSGENSGALYSLSANSPSSVWAAGGSSTSGSYILHWDGSSWTPSDPILPATTTSFHAVAAYGSSSVWAFGSYRDDASFSDPALIEVHPAFPTPTPTDTPTPTPTLGPFEFYDVPPGSLWYTYVHWLAQRGIVSGTSYGYYSPNANTTRAQFAKMITLGFGYPLITPSGGPSFTDVPPSYFAYAFIETAHAQGIISGYSAQQCQAEGRVYPCFGPNDFISRAQLVIIAVRAKGWALVTPGSPSFSDVPESAFAYAQIETAVSKGVISGFNDSQSYHPCADAGVQSPCFRPNSTGTRGQLARILYNTLNTAADTPTPTATSTQTSTPLPTTDTPTLTATLLLPSSTPTAIASFTPTPQFSPTTTPLPDTPTGTPTLGGTMTPTSTPLAFVGLRILK